MKAQRIFLLLFFSSLLLNSKCRKDNEPQLPPETTIGANTFGCKVDGGNFVPKGGNGAPGLVSHSYFLGNGPGGGWFMFVTASNVVNNPHRTVLLETDSLLLIEGNTYSFKKKKGFAYAKYASGLIDYEMSNDDTGNLIITKHDQTRHILSGRFSFSATSVYDQTKKVYITDGRFDVVY